MNPTNQTESQLLPILRGMLNVEESALQPQTLLREVGLDSIGLMSLIAHLEAFYDLKCTEEDTIRLFRSMTIADVAEWVKENLARKTS
jgi:acyl carrier protein